MPLKLAQQANDSGRDAADVLELAQTDCNDAQNELLGRSIPAAEIDSAIIRKGVDSGQLVNHLGELHTSILGILHDASAAGRPEVALKAVREARSNVELTARLSGLLKDGGDTNVQIAILATSTPGMPIEAAVIKLEET